MMQNMTDVQGDGTLDSGQDTADSLEQQKIGMWQNFAMYVTPSIQRVVEFAKRAPGFSELTQDDQLILIKSGFFEIWLVHVGRMFAPMDNTLTFSDGSYVTRQQLDLVFDVSPLVGFISRQVILLIYIFFFLSSAFVENVWSSQPEFVTALFTFAVTFNNLQLNDTEIGIFSAIVLLTAGESRFFIW